MSAHAMTVACLAAVFAFGCRAPSIAPSTTPRTRAELSAFQETSRYDDVRAFLTSLTTLTGRVRVESFSRSEEGRALPLVVVGDPPASSPAQAAESGKPVVFVMANIHAGEVDGKEAALHLARRLSLGDLQPLLKSAVWLFAPIYNADGNEKISLDNRSEQYGPIGGVGTRGNANALDLNRDFMKLESSEARGLVSLFARWNPDVIVDLHTTNGSYHGYHLTYATSLNPNAAASITGFARDRLLSSVREAMASRHALRAYDYGNFSLVESLDDELERFAPGETRRKAWRTFDARPRFGTNYVGLRNRISVLSEAYSYLSFEGRVKTTEAFVEEIMRFVAANGPEVRALVDRVDAEWSRSESPPEGGVAFALRPLSQPVDVLVGAIETKMNPRSGKPMNVMVDSAAAPTPMTVYDGFVATSTRRVPREYILQPSPTGLHERVARTLGEHGIVVERLGSAARRSVERFVITETRRTGREFQGYQETSVTGRFERHDVDVPSGSLVVRTNQPLGRLVFYLLEPESDDGLTTWNVFDSALSTGVHPVLKTVP